MVSPVETFYENPSKLLDPPPIEGPIRSMLSIRLSVCVSFCLSVCLSVYLSVCLFSVFFSGSLVFPDVWLDGI